MILHNVPKKDTDNEMYFHVPVCADLIRVLAHACAWENNYCYVMILYNVPKKDNNSEMYFHVPVCADLIRVLAHACAWENITIAP